MSGVSFEVNIKGLPKVQNLLRSYAKAVGGDAELHRRWGIQGLNWIDRNFRQQGALLGTPWAPLRPNTIANRRKGSSQILQDTGQLRSSFTMAFSEESAILGSANPVSVYHEYGTRPHIIRPKNGKFLVFTVEGFVEVSKRTGGGATTTVLKQGKQQVFARQVNHPGFPARRMLPRQQDVTFMEQILKTTVNYLKENEKNG